jgi:hypothetical protein
MIERTCSECHQQKPIHCTAEQFAAFEAGELIQRAMPNVSEDERELLISGICGSCFDKLFKDEESDIEQERRTR